MLSHFSKLLLLFSFYLVSVTVTAVSTDSKSESTKSQASSNTKSQVEIDPNADSTVTPQTVPVILNSNSTTTTATTTNSVTDNVTPTPGLLPQYPGLSDIVDNKNIGFVFVGGKGGVGKTTTACGLSIDIARKGRKTLLVSTDPAHSLSDAFGNNKEIEKGSQTMTPVDLSREVLAADEIGTEKSGSLHVLEINTQQVMHDEKEKWKKLMGPMHQLQNGYMKQITKNMSQGAEAVAGIKELTSTLAGVPGMDEALALTEVLKMAFENKKYDVIVFDTAPTGTTLKMMKIPPQIGEFIEKSNAQQQSLWNTVDVFAAMTSGNGDTQASPSVRDGVNTRMMEIKEGAEKINAMMRDSKRTRFVTVSIAESLSVQETSRFVDELNALNIRVNHVVVNQLIRPTQTETDKGIADELEVSLKDKPELLGKTMEYVNLLNSRRETQQKYLSQLKSLPAIKSNIRIVEMPLFSQEVVGPVLLREFGILLGNQISSFVPDNDQEQQALLDRDPSQLDLLYSQFESGISNVKSKKSKSGSKDNKSKKKKKKKKKGINVIDPENLQDLTENFSMESLANMDLDELKTMAGTMGSFLRDKSGPADLKKYDKMLKQMNLVGDDLNETGDDEL